MPVRRFAFLAVVCGLVAPVAGRCETPASAPPALVVRVKSLQDLRDDARYLAKATGHEKEAGNYDGVLSALITDKGLMGVDVKKPIGIYARIDPDTAQPAAVLLLPIADEKTVLNQLGQFNVEAKKDNGGVYAFTPQGFTLPVPVYARFADGYAYVTAMSKAALAEDRLLSPAKLFAEAGDSAVSFLVRLDQLPEAFRQLALGEISTKLAEAQSKKHAIKGEQSEAAARAAKRLIEEGSEVELRVGVDRQAGEIVGQLRLSGKPDSELRVRIADLGRAESMFGGLPTEDSAVRLVLRVVVPESARKHLDAAVDKMIDKAAADEKDADKREAIKKVLTALAPTLKSGDYDLGVSIRGPGSSGHYTLAVGVRVKDGKGIESALNDALKHLPPDDREKINAIRHRGAETVAGASVNRLDVQKVMSEHDRVRWGENPVYVCYRDDAVVVTAGEGGLAALKDVVALKPQTSPGLQLDVSVARAAGLGADTQAEAERTKKAASEAFADGRGDHVRFTIEGGEALTARLTVQAPVLKFAREMERHGEHHAKPKTKKKLKPAHDDDEGGNGGN